MIDLDDDESFFAGIEYGLQLVVLVAAEAFLLPLPRTGLFLGEEAVFNCSKSGGAESIRLGPFLVESDSGDVVKVDR